MINRNSKLWACLTIFGMTAAVCAQDHPAAAAPQSDPAHANCPMMQQDKSHTSSQHAHTATHLDEVNARGDRAMGFSQTATTHPFLLSRDGGSIQVEVNDPDDAANREKIREHLRQIARMFGEGNFHIPMLVHDQVPPGVEAMEQRKGKIAFAYEETGRGGRVRLSTADRAALAAVHEFLRFQITDHQTGDSLEINPQ
jgi:hypothetical protein